MNDGGWSEFGGFNFGSDPGDIFGARAEEPKPPDPEPPVGWPDVELDQHGRARERSHGGRPTLYTTPRVLAILAALFKGASRADAARRAGVGVSTFYVWLQLGRAGHPTYAPLAEAVRAAESSRGWGHLLALTNRRSFWKAFH